MVWCVVGVGVGWSVCVVPVLRWVWVISCSVSVFSVCVVLQLVFDFGGSFCGLMVASCGMVS